MKALISNTLRQLFNNKHAQLSLTNPRDAKACQKFLQFEVITRSTQVGNPVFIEINFLIQITSTYCYTWRQRNTKNDANEEFSHLANEFDAFHNPALA